MKIYKISQSVNSGYDTFDAAIVIANNEDEARLTLPCFNYSGDQASITDWAPPESVQVELIGKALPNAEAGVVVSCYNAG